MKMVGLSLAIASLFGLVQHASAATFTLTGGDTPFTFWLPDSPAPDVFYQGVSFVIYDVPAPSASGLVDITFYNKDWFDEEMRSIQIEDYNAGIPLYELFGTQLYTNAESTPTFVPGNYRLSDAGGKAYSLTIANDAPAIPEPGSWILMIVGLGAAGFTARRSFQITTIRALEGMCN